MNIITTMTYASPCGTLILGSMGGELCMCDWRGGKDRSEVEKRVGRLLDADMEQGESETLEEARLQLDEYFEGKRESFTVPLRMAGTEFQQRVWRELLQLPYGTTTTYADLARRIGKPSAVRAVASANGANALSLFVPCHRIVGTGGALRGYAGGLEAKQYLLELEQRICQHK